MIITVANVTFSQFSILKNVTFDKFYEIIVTLKQRKVVKKLSFKPILFTNLGKSQETTW